MDNLFDIKDFQQFAKFEGKSHEEAPDGYNVLRSIYNKLGLVVDFLKKHDYNANIIRNVYNQAQKYDRYHWARVYPKENELYNECFDKVFFVIGIDIEGFNIHIDSYESKGYYCNNAADDIKTQTWEQIKPEEASKLTLEELVSHVDQYVEFYKKEFNQFAREFGIKRSVDILNDMDINNIKKMLLGNHNIILTGAPGTGKTYLAQEIAKSMGAIGNACKLVQFHPSYDYTDFVEGLRPISKDEHLGFERKDGIFKAFCKDAIQATNPFVFIIDEINRGEVSKIFGELFYLIDPGYRGGKHKIDTQYQNLVPFDDEFVDGFYIPENVYIIGTMNDIDRSVESMDFAMRRRFAWKEISVESRQTMLDDIKTWDKNDKPEQSIIDEIKIRMNNLNAAIVDKYCEDELSPKYRIGLTKAYQIGASYFLKYGMYRNFDELWENHIESLLYEYLRGTTNIEIKIERLKKAYNDTTEH